MTITEIIRKTATGYKPASRLDDGPEWFADIRNRSRKSIISEVCVLSPSRAQALLNANPGNRKLSDATVGTYAADITGNRWAFNGEPIILSDTGELNDGQHRCAAVIEAGKAIEVLIVAGVPRAARTTTDMGRVRSVGDFIHMHGITDENKVAAVAAILLSYEKRRISFASDRTTAARGPFAGGRLTKSEVLSFARANLEDIKRSLSSLDGKKSGLLSSHSRMAGALAMIARETGDWTAATKFMKSIVDGEGLMRGSPALTARNKLQAEKAAGTLSPGRTFEILLRAWNHSRSGLSMMAMRLTNEIPAIAT